MPNQPSDEQLGRAAFDVLMTDAYDLLRRPEMLALKERMPASWEAICTAADALFLAACTIARETPRDAPGSVQ